MSNFNKYFLDEFKLKETITNKKRDIITYLSLLALLVLSFIN
jgi:hypothetical protein